jgi:hypothetical protein
VFVLFLFLACLAVAVFRAMLDRSIDQERERAKKTTVGSIMKKWTNIAASITRVLDVGLKKFKNPVHSGQFAGCTRLGVVNAKDTFGGTYGCRSVFHSV